MRFKITLELVPEVYGSILPISYQYELSSAVNHLVTSHPKYEEWLIENGLTLNDSNRFSLYCVSNLYVPKIYVQGDRLQINVPRIQFWFSVYPEKGAEGFVRDVFLDKDMVIGDHISRVLFHAKQVDIVTPVVYTHVMDYQTLSPVTVLGVRPNNSIEYLFPHNRYFAEFVVNELIERWEYFNKRPFDGDRRFSFTLLNAEKRKAVNVNFGKLDFQKVVGYMLKFRLVMDPRLQELVYVCGMGDYINYGFGYLELIDKSNK